jgi:hypothetical protein
VITAGYSGYELWDEDMGGKPKEKGQAEHGWSFTSTFTSTLDQGLIAS